MNWLDRFSYWVAPEIGTFAVRGVPIRLETTTYLEYYRARTAETKEPDTLDWIDRYGGAGKVFYDIGANIGLYTLYALLRHPKMAVEAFEPYAPNREALLRNLSLNKGRAAAAHSYALSDQAGFGTLHLNGSERGATAQLDASRHGTCRMKTLDGCVEEGLPIPTMLKIDVDGHEAAVLRGASQLLRHPRVETVLVEITGERHSISDLLAEAGLHVETCSDWTLYLQNGQPVKNVVFRRAA